MKTNKKFKVHIVSMYLYTPGMPFQWMTALSPPLRGGSGSALKRWAGDVKVWKGERRGVYVYTTHLIDHFHFGPVAPAHSHALPVWTFAVNSLRVNNNSIISCPELPESASWHFAEVGPSIPGSYYSSPLSYPSISCVHHKPHTETDCRSWDVTILSFFVRF